MGVAKVRQGFSISSVGEGGGAALAYLVPGEKSGGGEGEAGVLHASIREGGGQHEDVVLPPDVGTAQLLSDGEHLLCVGELEGGLLHKLLL